MSKRLRACDICDAMKVDPALLQEVICQRCHGLTCGSSSHTKSTHQYSSMVGCNAAKDLVRELSIPGAALDTIAMHLDTMWTDTTSIDVHHAIVTLFLKEFTYIQQIQLAYMTPNTLSAFLEHSADFNTIVKLVSRGTLSDATMIAMETDIQSGVLAEANIRVGAVFWLSFAEVIQRLQCSSVDRMMNGFADSTLPQNATLFGVPLDAMEHQVADALRLSSFLFVRHVIGTPDFITVMQAMCDSGSLANFLTTMRVPALRFIRKAVKGTNINHSLMYLINMAILNEAASLAGALDGYAIQPVPSPSSSLSASATIEESVTSSPTKNLPSRDRTSTKKKARLSLDLFQNAPRGVDDDSWLDDVLQEPYTHTSAPDTHFEWDTIM